MINESTIETCDVLGGCVGLVAFDHNPQATPGRVRPFIWAFLMLRGAVRRSEVVSALVGHVQSDDFKTWDDHMDRSPIEVVVDDVLAEMTSYGLLRLSGEDLYVLTPAALSKSISIACTLDAQMPDHLLMEVRQ